MNQQAAKQFHETVIVSSPWPHIGRSSISLMENDSGRITLMVDCGAALVHLRPTDSELVLLAATLTRYLEARERVEVAA